MPVVTKVDLSKNEILARLPEKESKRLLPHLRLVSLRQKQVLYRPDEAIRYAYFPQDAVISIVAALDDGRSVEVILTGLEGMLGLRYVLGGKTYGYVSVVQVAGKCLRISAKVVQAEFKRAGVLQSRLLRYTRYLLVQTSQTAACNRVHRLAQRLARWLLMTQDRVKSAEFPMTHEFLSDMLGAPRPEVTAAAGSLRRSGAIRYARGKMIILNRKMLESAACECYWILREELYG